MFASHPTPKGRQAARDTAGMRWGHGDAVGMVPVEGEGTITTSAVQPGCDMRHHAPCYGSGRTRAQGESCQHRLGLGLEGFSSPSCFVFTKMDFQQ